MMKQRNKHKYYEKFNKDSDEEETELFVKNRTPIREIPSIEKTISEGDTLQSLAIKYHCTIEEIKRLNNIHKENEIYARVTIKVPLKPFSEALAPVHNSGNTTPENKLIDIETPKIDVPDLSLKLNNPTDESIQVNEIIFNSQVILKPVENQSEDKEILEDEEVFLLPSRPADTLGSMLNCNGIDGDIPLLGLLLFIVVLIIAVPLILVFYAAEHHEKSHEQT